MKKKIHTRGLHHPDKRRKGELIKLVKEYAGQGLTAKEIARKVGYAKPGSVYTAAYRAGVRLVRCDRSESAVRGNRTRRLKQQQQNRQRWPVCWGCNVQAPHRKNELNVKAGWYSQYQDECAEHETLCPTCRRLCNQ